MKLFWTGYVAFMALGTTTVKAELTHDTTLSGIRSQSSPTYFSERWIQGCDLFGRNDDDKEDGPTAPTPTAPTPTAPTPTAPTPTAPTDQCQGLTVCNEQHEFITSVLAENGTYVCGCNLCDDRLTVTCDECSGCNGLEGKDVCIESIFTYDFIDQKNGTYEWTGADFNIMSTGVDSASNQVLFDYDSIVRDTTFNWLLFNELLSNENSTNEDSDFEVYLFIDGVRCNSFNVSGDHLCVFIIDCQNIDPDYYWDSCGDFFDIYENSSHPLHGYFGGSLYCPDDEAEISAEALSAEGKISMGGEPFRLPGHPRFPF